MTEEGPHLEDVSGGGDEGDRLTRIRALSDQMLLYYFALLSDDRFITNVAVLPAIQDELRARKLPAASIN